MNLSTAILGKDIYELTFDDLSNFFKVPQEETSVLEFKSGDIELHKIHREIAAFLNTEGGILILGAPKENTLDNRLCSGDLVPCKNIRNQDALMHSIGSNIAPSPSGIRIKTIEMQDGKVYVIEITKSYTPPHQVSPEGKYYIRLEREAKPAPHGIVEALFNRRQRPKLVGEVRILVTDTRNVTLFFQIENKSNIHADNICVMITMNGVKSIRGAKNLPEELVLKNDRLEYYHNTPNAFLVKGMSTNFEIAATLRLNLVQVLFSYYCKGTELTAHERLFNTESKNFIVKLDHDISQEQRSTGNSFSEFYSLQHKYLTDVLKKRYQLIHPYSRSIVYDKAVELGIQFPESYVEFLTITNGLSGTTTTGKIFNFYSLNALTISKTLKLFNNLFLPIGNILGNTLALNITNSTDCTICIINQGYHPRLDSIPVRQSFFDIIDSYLLETKSTFTL